jgi:predicted dehydrogenase
MGWKPMPRKLKLGIIGAGWPGQMHADAIRAGKLATLYACADLSEERRTEFAERYKPEKSFGDYHELLNDPKVDAAIICLPNFLHFPASLAALEANKHVLCEKPPTMTAAEMKVLRDEAKRRGLVYYFSRQFRFTPSMRKAKALVEEGRLGKIYHGKATFIRSRGIPVGIGAWFTEKQRSGGGALIDIGVHALDSVWYLMGTPKPVSVSAQVFRNFEHLVEVPIFDVEDSAYAFIRFENGAVVQLEAAWAGNLTDDIPPRQYFDRELVNSTLFGTKATIRLNPLTLFEDQDGKLVTVPLKVGEGEAHGFRFQLENFLEAIRGKAAPVNNADQAVELMEMLDAIYASSLAGREVPIVSL